MSLEKLMISTDSKWSFNNKHKTCHHLQVMLESVFLRLHLLHLLEWEWLEAYLLHHRTCFLALVALYLPLQMAVYHLLQVAVCLHLQMEWCHLHHCLLAKDYRLPLEECFLLHLDKECHLLMEACFHLLLEVWCLHHQTWCLPLSKKKMMTFMDQSLYLVLTGEQQEKRMMSSEVMKKNLFSVKKLILLSEIMVPL